MTIQLQRTGYQDSQYERPNQRWICGWSAEGNPCPMGPDGRGRCTARAQSLCTPHRVGDRYHCARPALFGGPCKQGPLPDGVCSRPEPAHPVCQPRLSIRARRGRLVVACVTLTTGLLTLLLAGPWGLSFVSPGPLSSAHGAIDRTGDSAPNCVACHAAAAGGPGTWLTAAFGSGTGSGDSARCLDCHFEGGDEARALLAHSAAPELLAGPDDDRNGTAPIKTTALQTLASLAGRPRGSNESGIACATCHHEHRGRDHDLSSLDDVRCQACHSVRFAGFADGHPEFEPVARAGAGIRFDHATHAQTHFGDAPFDCARCHQADGGGETIGLHAFSRSCSGCHYQGKPDHHGGRIKANESVLFQLPFIDLGAAPVYWPEEAATGEEIAAMMRLLLAGDDAALEAMRSLVEQETDWIPEYWEPDEESLKADLAAAIKKIFQEFLAGDEAALALRIAAALDADPAGTEVGALAEQLSAARFALLAYQRRWLPGLDDEGGGQTGGSPAPAAGPDWTPPAGTSGWYVDPDAVSISYRPSAHADPFLRGWIDALSSRTKAPPAAVGPDPDGVFRAELRDQLFEDLASKGSGGFLYAACLRCHVGEATDAGRGVHWAAAGAARSGGYARFDHRSHRAIGGGGLTCGACHETAEPAASGDRATANGLIPHRQEQCSGCHAPGGADHTCLTCHQYHFLRP